MILFEDLIDDVINNLKLYYLDALQDFEQYYILRQIQAYTHDAFSKFCKIKNLRYSYIEQLIIYKTIVEQLFALIIILYSYNVNLKYYKFFIKKYLNKIISHIIQNPSINLIENNFYQLSKHVLHKVLEESKKYYKKNKDVLTKQVLLFQKYLYNFKLKKYKELGNTENNCYTVKLNFNSYTINKSKFIKSSNYRLNLDKIFKKLFYNFGLFILYIGTIGSTNLKDNEYEIRIHNQIVSKGTFQYDSEESINDMFNHLETVLLDNVHKILSVRDTYRYLEYVKKEYSKKIVKQLLKELDINDIKIILCNLIKDRISITNIAFIVESLANFARLDKDVDGLTQKLKGILI